MCRRQGSPCRRRRRRRILPFYFLNCCCFRRCCRCRRCACNNLGCLLLYGSLIYPPKFSTASVSSSPAVLTVVPLPPLLVGVSANVTISAIGSAADPAALNPADPVVVWSFRRVGQYLSSSYFYSFSLSSSLSYYSPLTAAFVLCVIVPEEAEPVVEG